MFPELVLLRLIHILAGICWVGTAVFTTVFLGPALANSGPVAAQVMTALRARRLLTFLPIVSVATVASGLRLMWITSGGFAAGYFATPHGRAFALAGTSAILAFMLGFLVIRPTAARSAQLGAAVTTTPEPERGPLLRELEMVRRRNTWSSAVALTMLIAGAGGMAVARYLG